jgi:membrane protein YqaA with SNARE-associated domain
MIAALLATLLAGFVSAFVPLTPIEPYLVGLVAATGYAPLPLGIAAALGQTVGKLLTFLAARGALRSDWLRRRLARRKRPEADSKETAARPSRWWRTAARRLMAQLDKPLLTAPIVLLSAVTGVPPLLATSVYAARTRISTVMFTAACLLGRAIRLVAIAYAPDMFT